MPKPSVELREERAGLVARARTIVNKASTENRDMTAEETADYDRHMADVDAMKAKIDRIERLEAAESEMEAPADRSQPVRGADGQLPERRGTAEAATAAMRGDYRHWLRHGEVRQSLRPAQAKLGEYRDQVLGAVGSDTKGGYLVTPVQISETIVKQIDDFTFIRALAHVERVTEAKSLGVRQLTTRMGDANWTTEVAAVTEDTAQVIGRRDLTPDLLSKLALVSIRLLMASADAEKLVNSELAYKFGITEEKAYLTGSGAGQPLGVFTASANGIPTSQDTATATAATLAADDLISVKFALKQRYLASPKAGWILHRAIVGAIRKLKDNYGQYLWAPGIAPGQPDRILDVPYYMSEYAPSTVATGNYLAIIGNFEYYWIAEVMDMVIQRLTERYADTNQVGFIGRRFLDGAPVLGEAFARLKAS